MIRGVLGEQRLGRASENIQHGVNGVPPRRSPSSRPIQSIFYVQDTMPMLFLATTPGQVAPSQRHTFELFNINSINHEKFAITNTWVTNYNFNQCLLEEIGGIWRILVTKLSFGICLINPLVHLLSFSEEQHHFPTIIKHPKPVVMWQNSKRSSQNAWITPHINLTNSYDIAYILRLIDATTGTVLLKSSGRVPILVH
uniref:Uncharacterized protein n=1 Tax=Strigamia maritima TaxID=126957 RepID=T1IWQ0_STRMM